MRIDQDEALSAAEVFLGSAFGEEMYCCSETISAIAHDRFPPRIEFCGGRVDLEGRIDSSGKKEVRGGVSFEW